MNTEELMFILTLASKRCPQYEEQIFKNQRLTLFYLRTCLKQRGDNLPYLCYYYAQYIIRGRWPAAEDIIKTSVEYIYRYATFVVRGRWPEGEKILLERGSILWMFYYAQDVIKGRWPEADHALLTSQYKEAYLRLPPTDEC